MILKINDKSYKIVKDYGDTISSIDLNEMVTDYYDNFDFIVGDWAYGKVRLKGFYNENNKNVKEYNNIKKLDEYLEKSCAYGCKYFILEKESETVEKK